MCRPRHINPKDSLVEILVLIRNEHANDDGTPAASAAANSVVASSATTGSSSASPSVITSTVTTSSSPKRTMSLGEYKKMRGNTVFARDELEGLFDPASDQRRDHYIGLFHELRWYGNKKTSRRSRDPSGTPSVNAGVISLISSTATQLASVSAFA
ncbi:unnamed protein product [Phytophthora fragariaefolia]|uniref:Unnamed protein product n=1 Tax=Phytophthora fragariaefolia TaxID=1490495 RepID=A0A9W6XHA5_9STRA|nr:unnamed protein product [Phytophthora fragariaefolia]